MAVIKNKKTGMWEVRTYYKEYDRRKEAEDQEGLCEEKRSPRMGTKLQTERESEYQYELSKLCGYLFDGFGAENKTKYVPDKKAHY